MKAITKQNARKKPGLIFISLVILVSVIAASFYALSNINKSQYYERVANANILMEKICGNIKTVFNFNWENIHYVTYQLENEDFSSTTEMMEYISRCEDKIKGNAYTKILLISEDGFCYVTDGTNFKWMSPALLNEENDVMYVSDQQFASKTGLQMHYLSKFTKPFTVDGITFTHTSLVCDMTELDSFFNVSNYGEDSITFVIHKDGSQVYRQDKETKLSGIYNLLSALEKAEFGYDVTYEQFKTDIEGDKSDCVYLTLDDTSYFVSYYQLGIKDWVVILMVPEEHVGTGTQAFTKEIIISVVILFGSLLVLLGTALTITAYQINKKHKYINEQLIRAAEAERSANEAKTNFLSSMSHDIRTPMNAIVGIVAIASKRADDTDYIRQSLKKIELASDHLLTLINDILDISKVESGKMKLNPEKFSLAESFKNLINIMQPQIKEKNHDFYIRVHNVKNEYLYRDKLRLNQIFINLLSNAIKYTNENGKIWVDLYEDTVPNADDMVRIRYIVQDTGMGMSKKFQETMYHTFARATDSRTSKIQGSGLGLAIVKQMVELMGGTINCESEPGVGTTFTVTIDIPVINTDAEELSLPEMELLMVDDDEIFLETASDTLNDIGLKVCTANDGETAISHISNGNNYPLIIVDKRLPGIDGIETVRRIRKIVPSNTSIIMVSAYDASLFEDDAKAAGADGVITKPFFRSEVFNCIRSFIDSDNSTPQSNEDMPNDLTGTKLLIAEDNDLNWEIANTLLQMYGVSADRAENGKECVEMINNADEGYYALILMDVRMPVMDGREATRIIRHSDIEWVRSIPVIAMTADAFAEDVHECLEAGMNEHIAKPLDIDRLINILQKYCSKK